MKVKAAGELARGVKMLDSFFYGRYLGSHEGMFGGPELDTLFVTAGDRVYKRKVKPKGAPSFAAPVKPAPPRL